jgi:PPOX class probable F420-dependent enzyme
MPTDVEVEAVRKLAREDRGLAVIVTQRSDGSPQASVVNAGIMDHPVTGKKVVAFVSRGDAVRLKHLRRTPRATAVFRSGWQWIAVEGATQLAGPDDTLPGLSQSIPTLLRDVFTAAGGSHDNWAEYDRVMAEERRTAVIVEMERIYPRR